MEKRYVKKAIALVFIMVLMITSPAEKLLANNETPYTSYAFDKWGNPAPGPNGYIPSSNLRGVDFVIGEFSSPEDLFYCKERAEVYLADTGNKRIVVFDEQMKLLRVITELNNHGESFLFGQPTGIFVDQNGIVYVADQMQGLIIKFNQDNEVMELFGKPESDLLIEDFDYRPNKIVVDSYGKLYVQAVGIFQGIINLRPDGTFIKYYGANKVEMTFARVINKLWRSLLSDAAGSAMEAFSPIEYGNIFLAGDDFIYACAKATQNNKELLAKLNPLGIDIFNAKLQIAVANVTSFADITVDANGNFTVIDSGTGSIHQFDKTGLLLFAFGGKGEQLGLFQRPTAMIEIGEQIYVLDGTKNSITGFEVTTFGRKVREAINLYNEGLYQESIGPWQEIIKLNANYPIAYVGIGKAFYQIDNYKEAMKYYKIANAKENYSAAFKEYSLEVMRTNFTWIVVFVIAVFVGVKLLRHYTKKRAAKKKGGALRS